MSNIKEYFSNNFIIHNNNVFVITKDDSFVSNFGKQWRDYRDVQIDSKNDFNVSKNFLNELLFNNIDYIKNKTVLEIGCGAGRFTEHIVKHAKECISVDLSSAVYHNVSIGNEKLKLVKANFLDLNCTKKFDVVICRGVLQHTEDPIKSILKLHKFINNSGYVFFDIYAMPKIGYLHPKYFFWRPLIKKFIKYENLEFFLKKNIKKLLSIKRFIKKIFFNSNFISDSIIPIWDYKDQINLNKNQLEMWSILDTLDGIYAKYDKPISNKNIIKILKKNKISLVKNNVKKNFFMSKI